MLSLPENIVCGYFDSSEFGSLTLSPLRRPKRFEIELFLEDGGFTYSDGREYPIKRDHIQITRPQSLRHSHLPFKTLFVRFSADGLIAERLSAIPENFRSGHPDTLRAKFNELITLYENGDNPLLYHSCLLSLINLVLADAAVPDAAQESYPAISSAKQFIKENFACPIRLCDMAAAVNLSPTYFHTLFKTATGISPHDYLIRRRIEAAKELLRDSSVPLSRIAENCGFTNQQHFAKIFKKQTGLTPGRYRKNSGNNYLED